MGFDASAAALRRASKASHALGPGHEVEYDNVLLEEGLYEVSSRRRRVGDGRRRVATVLGDGPRVLRREIVY